MLTIRYETSFRRDYKRIVKRGYDPKLLEAALNYLINEKPLPEQYHDHALKNDWARYRECHIQPDWLLIYHVDQHELKLCLTRTGTHSDLFRE